MPNPDDLLIAFKLSHLSALKFTVKNQDIYKYLNDSGLILESLNAYIDVKLAKLNRRFPI